MSVCREAFGGMFCQWPGLIKESDKTLDDTSIKLADDIKY